MTGIKAWLQSLFMPPTLQDRIKQVVTKHTVDGTLHKDVAYCSDLAGLVVLSGLNKYRTMWGLRIRLKVVHKNAYRLVFLLNEVSGVIGRKATVSEAVQKSRVDSNNLKAVTLDDYTVTPDGLPLKPVEVYNAIVLQLEYIRKSLQLVSVDSSVFSEYYGRQLTHLMGDVEAVLLALLEVQEYAEAKPDDHRSARPRKQANR